MTVGQRFGHLAAICSLALGLAAADLRAAGAASAAEQVSEAQVKAAFLFNVVKFVQWPADDLPTDRIVIGLVARDSFRRTLEAVVNGKSVNGRAVVVRELQGNDDGRGCHIVFVENAVDDVQKAVVLRRAREGGMLTVGETTQFMVEGGLVRLYVDGNQLRFQIDTVGVQLSGLKVSAQLMSLAK